MKPLAVSLLGLVFFFSLASTAPGAPLKYEFSGVIPHFSGFMNFVSPDSQPPVQTRDVDFMDQPVTGSFEFDPWVDDWSNSIKNARFNVPFVYVESSSDPTLSVAESWSDAYLGSSGVENLTDYRQLDGVTVLSAGYSSDDNGVQDLGALSISFDAPLVYGQPLPLAELISAEVTVNDSAVIVYPPWTGVSWLVGGSAQCKLARVSSVPEPPSMLLLWIGLAGLAGIGRKRFRKS